MVKQADVPKLAAESPITGTGADRFQYHVAIYGPDGKNELTVSEDRIPDKLRPLIDRVKQASA